jgi:hypothetical protein
MPKYLQMKCYDVWDLLQNNQAEGVDRCGKELIKAEVG